MQLLSQVASQGTTVVCSVHQPRPEVVRLLDKVGEHIARSIAHFPLFSFLLYARVIKRTSSSRRVVRFITIVFHLLVLAYRLFAWCFCVL